MQEKGRGEVGKGKEKEMGENKYLVTHHFHHISVRKVLILRNLYISLKKQFLKKSQVSV
jgi:hypothetical protein